MGKPLDNWQREKKEPKTVSLDYRKSRQFMAFAQLIGLYTVDVSLYGPIGREFFTSAPFVKFGGGSDRTMEREVLQIIENVSGSADRI